MRWWPTPPPAKDCLNLIYEAGAIPVIAIRHDESDDEDEAVCKLRGYD